MPCNLFPHAYEKLIDEDIEWLKANSPDSLERDHILIALDFSKREYRARGYDEAMHKTGPHFPLAAAAPVPQPGAQASQLVDDENFVTSLIRILGTQQGDPEDHRYDNGRIEALRIWGEIQAAMPAPVAATQPSEGAKLADAQAPADGEPVYAVYSESGERIAIASLIENARHAAGKTDRLVECRLVPAAAPIEAQATKGGA